MSGQSILRPAMIIMGGRLLGYVACFAIPIVLVRVFDQATFGTYKQLFLVFGTLFGLAQLGMSESLFYFVPERARRAASYVCNALLVLAAAGTACAVGLWALREPIAGLLNNPALAATLPYIAWYLLFMLMGSLLEIVMTARKQHRAASATYAVSDVARAAAAVLPVLFIAELRWLLTWAVAFAAARFIAALVYALREFGRGFRPRRLLAWRQAAYAGPFSVAVLVELMQSQFHLYFVANQTDAATYAIYAIACLNVPLVEFLTSSVGNVLMVRMRELSRAGTEAVLAVWRDTVGKLALLMFPLVGVLLVTADAFIVALFTTQYAASVPVFMVWTLCILFAAIPADCGLRAYAQNRALIGLNLARLVVVLALVAPMLTAFGLVGPAAATVLALATFKLLGTMRIARVLGVGFVRVLPWPALGRTLVLAALAAVPALALKAATDWPPLLTVFAAGTVYAGAYAWLAWYHGGLTASTRASLREMVLRRLPMTGRAARCAE